MVKKLQKMSADRKSGPQLSNAVKESAQQIWLAGLGAFSKAQEEGGKVFETLVKEGMSIQRKTQAVAEEKISEATSKMSNMASDIQSRAGNRWDKLENIFEERVAKALSKLGVPSAKEVNDLITRVGQLEKHAPKMNAKATAPKAATQSAAKAPARSAAKPAAKKVARPAVKRAAKKAVIHATNPSAGTVASPADKPAAAAKRSVARKTS